MDKEIFDELLGEFLVEADERIGKVEQLMLELVSGSHDAPDDLLVRVRRELHTLKGNAGMMGLEELRRESHRLEDEVAEIDPAAPQVAPLLAGLDRCRELLQPLAAERRGGGEEEKIPDFTIRVPASRVERLSELVAEQVTVRASMEERMAALKAELDSAGSTLGRWRPVEDAWRELGRIHQAAREQVLALRMVPMRSIFGGLRRMAHDEAARSGKRIQVETRGEDTPLDRSLVEAAAEALGHLVRNAVVHGIETPDKRVEAGKRDTGTVLLRASVSADRVSVEVIDDGAGVNRERLRRVARRAGLDPVADEELPSLLFLPGLTTRSSAGLEAGRGVGLSAVRETVRRHGGDVELATEEGVGSRFCLALPASVATREVLLVEAGGARYALPVAAVAETVSTAALARDEGSWRGRSLPVTDLERILTGASRAALRREFVAVLEVEGRLCGVGVDRFGGLEEVVVHGVDPLTARPAVSGAAVLADGAAVLVLDPHELVSGGAAVGEPS